MKTGCPPPRYGSRWTTGSAETAPQALRRATRWNATWDWTGEGYVDAFDASPWAKYARRARIATRLGARTGLWSSELDRLFVGLPAREGHSAEIDVFGPSAPP